jgi:hypothetical protein
MNKKTITDKILNESIDDKINELTSRLEEKINILEDLIKVIEDPRKKFVIPILMK